MSFEEADFEELVRYLDTHPDLRDQLRRRILSDDFLRLPMDLHDLKGDVLGLKGDVQDLKGAVQELRADVGQLKSDVGQLKSDVQDLREAVLETHDRIDSVILAQDAMAVVQKETVTILNAILLSQNAIFQRLDEFAQAQSVVVQALQSHGARLTALEERTA